MIEQELFNMFSQLDINEKRNQISIELATLKNLLDDVHNEFNIEKMSNSNYIYNKDVDKDINDEDYYNYIYQNITFLRKDILTLINYFMLNKK